MARKKKTWTFCFVNGSSIDWEKFDDVEKLHARLGDVENPKDYVLFVGEPVPFEVSRNPTVIIGEKKERKARKDKGAERKPRKSSKSADAATEK